MLSTDFKIMTELTGHTCNASWMSDVDTLVLNQHNIKPLTSCIAHSKAYYDGLCATSQVACETLEEQLNFVKKEDSKLAEVNKNKKKALMTEYFDEKINELCQEKQGLQGFELRWLTDEIRLLKPNRLYVRIKNGTKLEYSVLNHAGIRRGTCFDLNRIDWPLNKPLLSIDELNPYLQKILTITSEKGDGHTPPHSLATDYQEALKRCLQDEQAGLVDQAIVSGSISIDDGLKDTQAAFNAQYLHSYHQLNGINTAVSDFRLYLNQAEKQHPKSREAIWIKKGILHRIDALSGESTRPVDDRIEEIRDFLKKPTILDNLMAYDGAQDGWYARLLHCVLHLMQSVGLYKPTVEKRVDALIDAIPPLDAALPSPPKSFRFFSETTREKIQSFRSETEVETPPFLPRPGGE